MRSSSHTLDSLVEVVFDDEHLVADAARDFAPALEGQVADIRRLHGDAQARGWTSEAARHERAISSLEGHSVGSPSVAIMNLLDPPPRAA